MYLKRIDLMGFKSFTDKTRIELEPGISCIVGPNGSGKSNIADALRWVLGEQSAKNLRGGKLEDVIFAGSKNRRPLGMSEVSITLDNSDGYLNQPFTEVLVTRRAFRSGQSEYLLNNQPCRLKDIHNLFIDSGMGLDSISLVGQDKIHEIINAKPEERRLMVEETAGILKYRNRKREALRKLDDAQRHLERVGDIIGELSIRLQPLSEQAAVAGRYLELTAEADQLEIAICVNLLTEAGDKLARINEQLADKEDRCLAAQTQQLQLEAQIEELVRLVDELDQEAALLQQQFYQMQTEKEGLSSQLRVLAAKKEALLQNQARLQRELADTDCENQQKKEQEEAISQQIEALAGQIVDKMSLIASGEEDEKSRRQAAAFLRQQLEDAKNQAFAAAEFVAECRNQIRYEQQMAENNRQSMIRLTKQKEENEALLQGFYAHQAEIKDKLAAFLAAKEEKEAEIKLQEKAAWQLSQSVQQLAADEADCRYRQHAQESRLAMLEEMAKNYEGFYPGVKSVLLAIKQQRPEMAGVIDVMASLLEVPGKYQVAVETCLGASLQNLVVRKEEDAKNAILYLKKIKGGRATFLPLDTLKVRSKADFEPALRLPGICGRASELVNCEPSVQKAVDFLLANTLVAEDLDAATKAAKALEHRYSVVTLEGDMLHPGGTLSGGSRSKKNTDLLAKKAALDDSRKELEALGLELGQWQEKLAAARCELAQKQQQAEAAQQETRELSQDIYSAQKDSEQAALSAQMAQQQLATIADEMAGLEADNQEIEEREQEKADLLQQKEHDYALLLQNIEAVQQQLDQKQDLLEAEQSDMTAFKVELAQWQQKQADLEHQRQRLQDELEASLWEQESKSADLEQLAKEQELLAEEDESLQQRLLLLERQSGEKEELLSAKRHNVSAELAQRQDLQKQAKEQAGAVEELRALIHQGELKKARLEAEWQNEEQKLAEKFRLTFAEASLRPQPDLPKRELAPRLKQLRQQIAALGVVNIGAIEEYREVSDRHQFLTEQREDLLQSIDSLQNIVRDMDRIMSSQFVKAFEQLNQEFAKSFKRLFDGGTAALIMSRPDDILETGVEISVQPPGKKVVNHNLLSGGEKALVGLSFLFAVLAVRPTPFCVMDEVDAALDDPNVERFAAYVQELSQLTQFLLISHRQGTMETASSLWGVTMAEEGISKVISVRL